jgi:hypothetical protein
VAARLHLAAVALAQRPFGLGPFIRGSGADGLRQVQARQARKLARQAQRIVRAAASDDGAGLGALLAQDAGQLAGVNAGNQDDRSCSLRKFDASKGRSFTTRPAA